MVHFFRSNIAQKYGVNAAVLADFIWDCIEEKAHGSRSYTRARFGFAVRYRC